MEEKYSSSARVLAVYRVAVLIINTQSFNSDGVFSLLTACHLCFTYTYFSEPFESKSWYFIPKYFNIDHIRTRTFYFIITIALSHSRNLTLLQKYYLNTQYVDFLNCPNTVMWCFVVVVVFHISELQGTERRRRDLNASVRPCLLLIYIFVQLICPTFSHILQLPHITVLDLGFLRSNVDWKDRGKRSARTWSYWSHSFHSKTFSLLTLFTIFPPEHIFKKLISFYRLAEKHSTPNGAKIHSYNGKQLKY